MGNWRDSRSETNSRPSESKLVDRVSQKESGKIKRAELVRGSERERLLSIKILVSVGRRTFDFHFFPA